MRKSLSAILASIGLLLGLGVVVAPVASAATVTDVWYVRVNVAGQPNSPIAQTTINTQATNVSAFWRSVPGNPGVTSHTPQTTYNYPNALTCQGNYPDGPGTFEAAIRSFYAIPSASKIVAYLASSQSCLGNGVSGGTISFIFDGAEATAAHELGHNLGFQHDRRTPDPGFPADGSEEYGNTYSIMGGKTVKPYGAPAGWQQVNVGWMTYSWIPRVNTPTKVAPFKTAATSARLLRFDIANAATPGGWDVYYVEYRYGETAAGGEVGGVMLYRNHEAITIKQGLSAEPLFTIGTSYKFASCYTLNVGSKDSTGALVSYTKTC